jgi:glucose/arabinose dehydrogenase
MKVFVTLFAILGLSIPALAAGVPKIRLERLVRGFEFPLYVIGDGSDRLFVVEQPGRIKIVRDGAILPKPFLDIHNEVDFQVGSEKGLLSLAFHPNFKDNGFIYVAYSAPKPKLHTVYAEFHVEPGADTVDPSTERILFTVDKPFPNHNGGLVMFGPDGFLYIGTGDGGKHDDPFNSAQNPDSLLGKILRIDVNERDPYGIPKDNPFADGKSGRPEIYAWGLRNPWRFSFDSLTHECYAGDVGQNDWEEVDLIVKGGNYGWRAREGLHPNPNLRHPDETPSGVLDPIIEYPHRKKEGARDPDLSITGGYVYRGNKYPALVGWYFYGDYVSGRIWGLKQENGKVTQHAELLHQDCNPSSFGVDKDGEMYLTEYSRGILTRIVGE